MRRFLKSKEELELENKLLELYQALKPLTKTSEMALENLAQIYAETNACRQQAYQDICKETSDLLINKILFFTGFAEIRLIAPGEVSASTIIKRGRPTDIIKELDRCIELAKNKVENCKAKSSASGESKADDNVARLG